MVFKPSICFFILRLNSSSIAYSVASITLGTKKRPDFVKGALVERERIKFEFTKNLSETLEIIAKLGKSLGFKREEIANLDIETILNSSKITKSKIKEKWRKEIQKEFETKEKNKKLVLPSIIFSENDFHIIKYYISTKNLGAQSRS